MGKTFFDINETQEPQARHHCPACRALTLAPLGQAEVACASCGTRIEDERAFIDLYAVYVDRRLRLREHSPTVRTLDYAEVDALVTKSLASKRGHC